MGLTKKLGKIVGIGLLLIIAVFNIYVLVTGKTYVYKALRYNFADIDDWKIFEQRQVDTSKPQPWRTSTQYNKRKVPAKLDSIHTALGTVAFLVVMNDSLQHEQYWESYSDSSISNSFSMAKSIISILIGIAYDEGKIKSLDQPVGDFLPSYKEGSKSKITIKNLLTMSSGTNWEESYSSPFSMTTEAYYGDNLKTLVDNLQTNSQPGQFYDYKSGDTQILSFVLQSATGVKVSTYASEKLWKKIGAEHPAYWSIDKTNGDEKAYCCFYSNARDFARIGKLYLNQGKWDSVQVVSSNYVKESLSPSLIKNKKDSSLVDFYGYQWWLVPSYRGVSFYYARGIGGQNIIVIPSKNAVVVRLGKKRGSKIGVASHYAETFTMVDWVLDAY